MNFLGPKQSIPERYEITGGVLSDCPRHNREVIPNLKWEVFATAPDQLTAESWLVLMRNSGIECKLQPGDTVAFLGVSGLPTRIMARSDYVENALTVLNAYLGDSNTVPSDDETTC